MLKTLDKSRLGQPRPTHFDPTKRDYFHDFESVFSLSNDSCSVSEIRLNFVLWEQIENGLKGTSFPIIIADATICQELRLLESEFVEFKNDQENSTQAILHFLNELGWLFQKKGGNSDYALARFKFLLVFSVERDFVALMKTLLGILLQKSAGVTDNESSLEMLSGINLLNRAVKRKCKSMIDLLIHYSMVDTQTSSRKYIFPPNLPGPDGITPLHLAACTSDSDDMVDALTNDPQEVNTGIAPNTFLGIFLRVGK